MSNQISITDKKPSKIKTRCTICLSNYTNFIDRLIYSGFTNDQVLDVLLKENISGITIKHIRAHKSYHIDKDKIDISKLEEMQSKLRDHVLTLNNAREGGLQAKMIKDASLINKRAEELSPSDDLKDKKESLKKVNQRLAVKKKDLNLFDEMTHVMEINRERLDDARQIEIDNEGLILANTSKLADSHFRNAVKMHEITSGMESLQDIRLAELLTMNNNLMFSHEVSDITRFEMFRLYKKFEHTGLDPEQVPKNENQAKEFEHAHSFASVHNEVNYDKMLAQQDKLKPEEKKSKSDKVFVRNEVEEEVIYVEEDTEEINKNNDININSNKNNDNSKSNNKNNNNNKKSKTKPIKVTDKALELLNQFR
jgi:hypothetical protein